MPVGVWGLVPPLLTAVFDMETGKRLCGSLILYLSQIRVYIIPYPTPYLFSGWLYFCEIFSVYIKYCLLIPLKKSFHLSGRSREYRMGFARVIEHPTQKFNGIFLLSLVTLFVLIMSRLIKESDR